jgi:hypothetical protein
MSAMVMLKAWLLGPVHHAASAVGLPAAASGPLAPHRFFLHVEGDGAAAKPAAAA